MIPAIITALAVAAALMPWMHSTDRIELRITPMYPLGLYLAWATLKFLENVFSYPGRRNR